MVHDAERNEDTMQISEYSFYRLYRTEEDRLTRELEFRRIADERRLEAPVSLARRAPVILRLVRRLRGSASSAPHLAPDRAHGAP
ncbi:MAG: hypothetical protein JWN09_237 [Microbacteriaceae bacterium]|jgi:hypothetical protein|nr:hypothetical protein [Microbacteriaceae bacterium]